MADARISSDTQSEQTIAQAQEAAEPAPVPPRPFWHPGTFIALLRGRPLLVGVALLTVLFVLLTGAVINADLRPTPWDYYITLQVQLLPYMPVGAMLVGVSAFGFAPWNWLLMLAVIALMLLFRWRTEAIFTGISSLGGLSAEIVKNIVDRPRPSPDLVHVVSQLHTFSFPSGHVTGYVVFFGFLFYLAYTLMQRRSLLRWALLEVLAIPVLLVGLSRVYMGQHWASDALAGYALGFAYLFVVIELYRLWQARHPKTPTVPAATYAEVARDAANPS